MRELAPPNISVIIPFLAGPRGISTIEKVLASSSAQSTSKEIIVVANFPRAELKALCESMGVNFFCTNALGVNKARNLGAKKASAEILYFLDDDCVLKDRLHLSHAISLLKKHPEFFAIGGPYESQPGVNWRVRGYNMMASAWPLLGSRDHVAETISATNLLGGNFCLTKENFGTGFCDSIISGGDETELFQRQLRLGKALGYTKKMAVLHLADSTWRGMLVRAKNQGLARRTIKMNEPSNFQKISILIKVLKKDIRAMPFFIIHFAILFLQRFKAPHASPRA